MLKYAQAQVDLDAEILKSHETSNKTLSQIEQDLEAILRQGSLSGQKSSTAPSAAAPSAAAPSAAAPSAAAPSAAAPGGVKPENDFTFSQPVKPENDFTGRQPVNPENDFTTNADKVGSVFDKLATSGEKAADNLDKVPVPKDSVDSDVQQRAGGGEIHGVGTGTSDGVHVMASAGEFFHKTAAVQHYGLPFMHAVNNMQLPKFSLGGLVDGLSTPLVALDLPHFAEGGPVMASPGAGLHPVPIHFNGQHVGTLFGTPDAVSQMQARSTMDQIANLGPKPSHYSR
jgi:hypothetical protein